jgi:hypothetical protein
MHQGRQASAQWCRLQPTARTTAMLAERLSEQLAAAT